MGVGGRIACIATPMLLSIGSLICLFIVFLGGTNKSNSTLSELYYFKADTSAFKSNFTNIHTGNSAIDSEISSVLGSAVTNNNLSDIYEVYFWNFCTGSVKNGTDSITWCSPRKSEFVFDPIKEWGLNGTVAQNVIPKAVNDALNTYEKSVKWMFITYVLAFWVTVLSIVLGLLAICSRIGSCLTSIVSWAATSLSCVSAILSTAIFATLVGSLNTFLKEYDVKFTFGSKMIALEWIAVAFSLAASLFWTISICCCGGHLGRRDRKQKQAAGQGFGGYAPFANRGYAPLGEGAQQHQNPYVPPPAPGMEMQDFGYTGAGYKAGKDTAYEPFRHGQV